VVGPLEIDALTVVVNGVSGNDDSGEKDTFWQGDALAIAADGAAVGRDSVMMAGRNGVTDDRAGSNWMGGIERDQRDAVAGHAGNAQSPDHAIVTIFEMQAVASAVG